MDAQAQDRAHRIGQTRPVAVYRLVTENSVEVQMLRKAASKLKLERLFMAGGYHVSVDKLDKDGLTAEQLEAALTSAISAPSAGSRRQSSRGGAASPASNVEAARQLLLRGVETLELTEEDMAQVLRDHVELRRSEVGGCPEAELELLIDRGKLFAADFPESGVGYCTVQSVHARRRDVEAAAAQAPGLP